MEMMEMIKNLEVQNVKNNGREVTNQFEIFHRNMEEAGFTNDFIVQALKYFNELEEDRKIQEMNNIKEVIDHYGMVGSFTCSILKSEENLKELREDIALLKEDYPEMLDLNLYFINIEHFEISMLYLLFYEFYPQEEEEEEEIN